MATQEQRELLMLFMAALRAVAPAVTDKERALVQEVVDGMLRERSLGAASPGP
jgi:hypothetical protein